MGYIATEDGTVTAHAGQTVTTLPIHRGLHAVFWYAEGAVGSVRFTGATAGLVACTDEITAGAFKPVLLPATAP